MGRRLSALLAIASASMSGCALAVPRPVTYLSDTGATLNANVHSSVQGETTYQFFYGETTSYGAESEPLTVVFGDDDRPHPVSVPFSGLAPNTTYHWQVCAHDLEEDPPREVCSEDQTFATEAPGGVNAIAFTSNRDGNDEIYAMNTDGTNPRRLTNNPASDIDPSWSPNGRQIAFSSNRDGTREIYVIDADGGNPRRVTNNSVSDSQPAWSPAGDKIMVMRASWPGYAGSVVVEMNVDGSGERVVADVGTEWRYFFPFWAPDSVGHGYTASHLTGGFPPVEGGFFAFDASGREVASIGDCTKADWHPFGRDKFVFACNFGGDTHVYTELTGNLGLGTDPSWSPHGLRIAFVHDGDIWTMNANGSNRVNRTNTAAVESSPAWSHRP